MEHAPPAASPLEYPVQPRWPVPDVWTMERIAISAVREVELLRAEVRALREELAKVSA